MPERIANFTGTEKCRWCLNDALVCVSITERGMREYAPCPYCERGFRSEFRSDPKKPGPWGKEGYWRGREPQGLEAP